MKKFLAVLASLAMMVSLTGCGGGGSDGDILYYALDTEAKSLDSTVATDGASFTAIAQFVEGLTVTTIFTSDLAFSLIPTRESLPVIRILNGCCVISLTALALFVSSVSKVV